MNAPGEQGDELLRDVATGRLERADPRVAARLANDAEFARALHELEQARGAAERALHEGARLTEEAVRTASAADRARVLATLESLARGERAGRRRGFLYLVAGLAAAAALVFLVLRPGAKDAAPTEDVPLGGSHELGHEPAAVGPGKLTWNIDLSAGQELWLSFFALRDGARAERLLGPLDVSTTRTWQATTADERARLSGDWLAELELRSADEARIVASTRRSPSR